MCRTLATIVFLFSVLNLTGQRATADDEILKELAKRGCAIVAEVSVNRWCSLDTKSKALIYLRAGHPAAIVAFAMVDKAAICSKEGRYFSNKVIADGCDISVELIGETIRITVEAIEKTEPEVKKLAAIYQCINDGQCVNWLLRYFKTGR